MVLAEAASKVEAKVRGKRIFKIIGYVGLVMSLFMQGAELFSLGFVNVMIFVLLIDLSGKSYELVEEASEPVEEAK